MYGDRQQTAVDMYGFACLLSHTHTVPIFSAVVWVIGKILEIPMEILKDLSAAGCCWSFLYLPTRPTAAYIFTSTIKREEVGLPLSLIQRERTKRNHDNFVIMLPCCGILPFI